jgi:hypothetical protein
VIQLKGQACVVGVVLFYECLFLCRQSQFFSVVSLQPIELLVAVVAQVALPCLTHPFGPSTRTEAQRVFQIPFRDQTPASASGSSNWHWQWLHYLYDSLIRHKWWLIPYEHPGHISAIFRGFDTLNISIGHYYYVHRTLY